MAIKIDGEIGWDVIAEDIQRQLDEADGDIEVVIDSPGGSVFEGVKIFNAIKSYKGRVTVTINSLAASMATYIAMAGDFVRAYDNATFMIHNAWGFAMGDHRVMRDTAEVLEGLSSLISKKYREKTGKSEAEIKAMMDKETYLFGEEIKEHGFVDEIISTEDEKNKQAQLALASERFKACLKNLKEKEEDESKELIAALLKEVKNSEEDREVMRAKLKIAKMKLKLLEKEIT